MRSTQTTSSSQEGKAKIEHERDELAEIHVVWELLYPLIQLLECIHTY